MIKVTIEQLVGISNILQRLAQHRFPAGQHASAYRLNKLRRAVDAELQFFQTERRRLIEEFGTSRRATLAELSLGSDPIIWEVLPDSPQWISFSTRMKEILSIVVDLTCSPLALDTLATVELSASDIDILDPILSVEDVKIEEVR